MSDGWVKLHRRLLDNPRANDPDWIAVWVYLLLNATHAPRKAKFNGVIIDLKPGQLVTGRHVIADSTGVNESKVRRVLNALKSDQQIDQQAGAKSSIITVLKWDTYQNTDQQISQQVTSNRPASDQQVTTLQEGKKGRMRELRPKVARAPEVVQIDPLDIPVELHSPEFSSAWQQWMTFRRGMSKKPADWAVMFGAQLGWLKTFGAAEATVMLNESIRNGWQGLFARNQNAHSRSNNRPNRNEGIVESDHPSGLTGAQRFWPHWAMS